MIRRHLGWPLVSAELNRHSRRMRVHLGRWLFLLATCIGFAAFWYSMERERAGGYGQGMAQMAVDLFAFTSWAQLILLGLGAMQTASGALSDERSQKTLEVLLSTPMSSLGILAGKYLSLLFRAVLYLLAILPLFGLLMSEGGIALEQILGVMILSICFVLWCGSLGFVGAVLSLKPTAGAAFSFLMLLLYAIVAGVGEIMSEQLARSSEYANLVPVLSQNFWFTINFYKTFMHIAIGSGGIPQEDLWRILLSHVGIASIVTVICMWLAAGFLRPVAQLGKLTIIRAMWQRFRGHQKDKPDLPRRRWELAQCIPWARASLAWRMLSQRATPDNRRRRGIIIGGLILLFTFAPFFFYVGEFVVTYTAVTIEEFQAGRSFPPLPQHTIWEGGSLKYLPQSDRTVHWDAKYKYRWTWRRMHRSKKFLEGWAATLACMVAGFAVIVTTYQMAGSVARERSSDRLTVLLSAPLSNHQLVTGFFAQAFAGNMGMWLATPFIAIIGLIAGYYPFFSVLTMLLYIVVCSAFFGCLSLRVGMNAKSVRQAQTRSTLLYLGLAAGWPIFIGLTIAFLRIHEDEFGLLCALSPVALPGFIAIGFEQMSREYGRHDAIKVIAASLGAITLYSGVALALWFNLVRNFRQITQSKN